MEGDFLDGVDDSDNGAVGGVSRGRSQTFESLFDSYVSDRWDLLNADWSFVVKMLQKLSVCLKRQLHLEAVICQEHGYFNQGCGQERHIHPPGTGQQQHDPPWELDHPSSGEAETVNICENKRIVLSRDVRGQDRRRSVDPEQDQGGLPSNSNRSHAIVPSGSFDCFDFLTFMSVLTSLYYSSESRPVVTEMNNSTSCDAYCFGNVFVSMSALLGSSAVPILHDSAQIITESFESAVVPRDGLGGNGDDDDIDGVTIPFQM